MSYQPTNKMRFKLNLVVLPLFLAFTGWIIVSLFKTSITENNKYQALANENQFKSTIVKANRGSIYDTNGKILAQSATVYSICVNPNMIYLQQQREQKKNDEESEAASGIPESQRMINAAATILSEELGGGVTYDLVVEKLTTNGDKSRWALIAKSIEKPVADKIAERAEEENLGNLIFPELDTKRYYPQAELAASVIGFTNFDGDGVYGIESYYNEYLKGVDGKIISARDGYGNEMPYKNDKMYESQDGNSVYLTLDMTLQYYVEKYLQQQVQAHAPAERACAIMMNAKTGAIYAMATVPGYDLNERNEIYNPNDVAYLSGITDEEEYNEQYTAKREQQWKNKAITELYFPGSVFKVITGSSALEEKVIDLNSHFDCGQVIQVADVQMHCWSSYSHGTQDFTTAMTNSCNPAFIQIGQRLGKDKFYEYFKAFGFTEKTGIDLPGEADSIYVNTSEYGPVELASSSFGQTNKVTPIQMITAYAAVINGGYLVTPYVVSKIVDPNGNIVKTTEPSIKRQVISEETSAQMREVLENVVVAKDGSNAYIKGYDIGGKSGTSQKLDDPEWALYQNQYVSSYCAFAPADDPEIIMLVMVDEPFNGKIYGSAVAAPVISAVFSECLENVGIYAQYTAEELENQDTTVPYILGMDGLDAVTKLNSCGLKYEFVGDENGTVTNTTPGASLSIPKGGTVVVYMDEAEKKTALVPNVVGMTVEQANNAITSAGLNISLSGGAIENENAKATSQSIEAGAQAYRGAVVQVTFIVNDETG